MYCVLILLVIVIDVLSSDPWRQPKPFICFQLCANLNGNMCVDNLDENIVTPVTHPECVLGCIEQQ